MRRFGDFTAVNDISFSVDAGELFGFLGPNGAGKTTTISILCTLLHPSGGRARVAGYDVATERDRVRSSIGLVFQEITLDDYLTAAENLRFHAVMYGVPNNEIEPRMTPLLEMVVVLPAPLGPRKPKSSPASTENEMSFTAVKSPKRRTSPSTSTAAPALIPRSAGVATPTMMADFTAGSARVPAPADQATREEPALRS